MAKKREKSEVEYLRGIVKNQRSIIKHLQKEVSRGKKRQHQEELIAEELLEDEFKEQEIIATNSCPECFKGKIETVDLGARKMTICDSCKFRKIRK